MHLKKTVGYVALCLREVELGLEKGPFKIAFLPVLRSPVHDFDGHDVAESLYRLKQGRLLQRPCCLALYCSLERYNLIRTRAFLTLPDFKLNCLTIVECCETTATLYF